MRDEYEQWMREEYGEYEQWMREEYGNDAYWGDLPYRVRTAPSSLR
jgi:hypothetical protein